MLPSAILSSTVTIKRRTSTGRDSLNNPTYGAPTGGTGWNTVYNNVPVRLAYNTKLIAFSMLGERVIPNVIMYYNSGYTLQHEDRVLTEDGVEYVVTSIVEGKIGAIVNHFEAILSLP